MKLLHILNEINFSGAEVMLSSAAPIFKKNGFELHALSTGNNIGNYSEVLEKAGYKIHHIKFGKNPKYFFDIYKLLKKERFDVVHIHPERAFVWHALVAKICRVKIIVRSVHNIFNFKGILKLKKYLARWFARKVLKVKFHSISDSVEIIEKENFGNPTVKIYNWIEENKFYPLNSLEEKKELRKQIGVGEDKFIIISVGSCNAVKRHYAIIEALAKILEKVDDVVYIHLGNGELLNNEKELAQKLGINNNIIFAGQKENVRDYLAASDLFIMVSEYEGLSIASLEAMFCGLPLIVTDTYGLRDVVTNNYNGTLLKDINELDVKILEIYNSPELRKTYSKNSFKLAKEKFSMEKSVKQLINIYFEKNKLLNFNIN